MGHEDATEFVPAAALPLDRDRTPDREAEADDLSLPPGTVLGRYVIIEAIGRGGMGHVYAARDPELERRVAIKTLRRRSVRQFGSEQILLAEAQALAKLSHPNVVTVYDAGTHEDAIFVAMEHIEGITVQRWLETVETPPPWHVVLDVFLAAGRGLAAAHRNGIVHRDFKPSNVMIDGGPDPAQPGRVRVVDFGLALMSERDPARASFDSLESSSGGFEGPRVVVGTPAFMAPEQMSNEGVDERSDQFAFCVSLWTALYGARPFAGTKVRELQRAILGRSLQPSARVVGPGRIRRHLLRGLEPDPDRRWPSMEALLERLESDRRLPRRRAIAGLLGVAGIVLPTGGYLLASAREPDPCPDASPRLRDIWDEARADAIGDAFAATGKPFAAQVWATSRAQLDAWTAGWVEANRRACVAARVDRVESDEVFDRRVRCLTSARTDLAATVDLLANADDGVVVGAVKAVSELPSTTRCVEADLGAATQPDPEIADRVAELERELASVRALMRTAGFAKASEALERLATDAKALGWAPLLADVLVARGETLMYDKRFDEAETVLLEGLWTALPVEHDHTAAAAWVHLVRSAALGGRLDDAERYDKHAEAFVPRLHGAPQIELALLTNRGLTAFSRGDYETAASIHADVLENALALYGERHIQVAAAHNLLGMIAGASGDHVRAIEEFEQVHALTRDLLGDTHPDVATALGNIAVSKQKLDQVDEARALHARVLEIREAALGLDHPDTGVAYGNLGALEHDAGRWDLAVDYLTRALRIKERTIGADHPSTLLTLTNLGLARIAIGQAEDALPEIQRAHDRMLEALGPEHPHVFYPRLALGRALVRVGRPGEAIPILELVVASEGEAHGRAEAELELARALDATHRDPDRVIVLARSARDRYAAAGVIGEAGVREAEAFLAERGR